jgi:hypothetical protein
MAYAVVMILKANNEQQILQNSVAAADGYSVNIYRQEHPEGVRNKAVVADFDVDAVQSWCTMSDSHSWDEAPYE